MPCKETSAMNEREAFIITAGLQSGSDISHLCQRFRIAHKTGYNCINRFEIEGLPGF